MKAIYGLALVLCSTGAMADTITRDTHACVGVERALELDKEREISPSRYRQSLLSAALSRECMPLRAGTSVQVVASYPAGLDCLSTRPESAICYWAPSDAVRTNFDRNAPDTARIPTALPTRGSAQARTGRAMLRVLDESCSSDNVHHVAQGRVMNIGNEPLDQVWIVTEFLGAGNKLVSFESSALPFAPFQPGQVAPFEVRTSKNPAITGCVVTFKKFLGEVLAAER